MKQSWIALGFSHIMAEVKVLSLAFCKWETKYKIALFVRYPPLLCPTHSSFTHSFDWFKDHLKTYLFYVNQSFDMLTISL